MNWTIYPTTGFERLAPTWNALNEAAGGLPFLHMRFVSDYRSSLLPKLRSIAASISGFADAAADAAV